MCMNNCTMNHKWLALEALNFCIFLSSCPSANCFSIWKCKQRFIGLSGNVALSVLAHASGTDEAIPVLCGGSADFLSVPTLGSIMRRRHTHMLQLFDEVSLFRLHRHYGAGTGCFSYDNCVRPALLYGGECSCKMRWAFDDSGSHCWVATDAWGWSQKR